MEHVNVTLRKDGFYKLTPDAGYVLSNGREERSQVITKKVDEWWAVENITF